MNPDAYDFADDDNALVIEGKFFLIFQSASDFYRFDRAFKAATNGVDGDHDYDYLQCPADFEEGNPEFDAWNNGESS